MPPVNRVGAVVTPARSAINERGANFEAAPEGGGKGAVLKYVHEDPKSVARTILKAHR